MWPWTHNSITVESLLNTNIILKRQNKDARLEIERMRQAWGKAEQLIRKQNGIIKELESYRRETSKADLVLKLLRMLCNLLQDKVPHRKPGERQAFYDKTNRELDEVTP